MPFRLLDLPPEIQDLVYEQIAIVADRKTYNNLRRVSNRFRQAVDDQLVRSSAYNPFPPLSSASPSSSIPLHPICTPRDFSVRRLWLHHQLANPRLMSHPLRGPALKFLKLLVERAAAYNPSETSELLIKQVIDLIACRFIDIGPLIAGTENSAEATESRLRQFDINQQLSILFASLGNMTIVRDILATKLGMQANGSYPGSTNFPSLASCAAARWRQDNVFIHLYNEQKHRRTLYRAGPAMPPTRYALMLGRWRDNLLWALTSDSKQPLSQMLWEYSRMQNSIRRHTMRHGPGPIPGCLPNPIAFTLSYIQFLKLATQLGNLLHVREICYRMELALKRYWPDGLLDDRYVDESLESGFGDADLANRWYMRRYSVQGPLTVHELTRQIVLCLAAEYCRATIVHWALSEGASPAWPIIAPAWLKFSSAERTHSPAIWAIRTGDTEIYNEMWNHDSMQKHLKAMSFGFGEPWHLEFALHHAVEEGHSSMIRKVLGRFVFYCRTEKWAKDLLTSAEQCGQSRTAAVIRRWQVHAIRHKSGLKRDLATSNEGAEVDRDFNKYRLCGPSSENLVDLIRSRAADFLRSSAFQGTDNGSVAGQQGIRTIMFWKSSFWLPKPRRPRRMTAYGTLQAHRILANKAVAAKIREREKLLHADQATEITANDSKQKSMPMLAPSITVSDEPKNGRSNTESPALEPISGRSNGIGHSEGPKKYAKKQVAGPLFSVRSKRPKVATRPKLATADQLFAAMIAYNKHFLKDAEEESKSKPICEIMEPSKQATTNAKPQPESRATGQPIVLDSTALRVIFVCLAVTLFAVLILVLVQLQIILTLFKLIKVLHDGQR